MPWLHYGHVSVGADQSKEPKSNAGVENSEGGNNSTEDVSKGPVVQVVVDHPEGKKQDEGQVDHSYVDHVDSDRRLLLGGQGEHPQSCQVDDESNNKDKAVEDQACHPVLRRTLVWSQGHVGHVGDVQVQRHSATDRDKIRRLAFGGQHVCYL